MEIELCCGSKAYRYPLLCHFTNYNKSANEFYAEAVFHNVGCGLVVLMRNDDGMYVCVLFCYIFE